MMREASLDARSPGNDRKHKNIPEQTYKEFAPFLALGMQLAAAVVVFFFIGKYVDRRFGTEPWGTIAGLLVGSTGGFIKFFKTALRLAEKEKK